MNVRRKIHRTNGKRRRKKTAAVKPKRVKIEMQWIFVAAGDASADDVPYFICSKLIFLIEMDTILVWH